MRDIRVNCPCGCESELAIGVVEKGDMWEDDGNLLISVGKKGQTHHNYACVINKEILNKLNSYFNEKEKKQ